MVECTLGLTKVRMTNNRQNSREWFRNVLEEVISDCTWSTLTLQRLLGIDPQLYLANHFQGWLCHHDVLSGHMDVSETFL